MTRLFAALLLCLALALPCARGARLLENLDRGLVAVPTSATTVFLGWRLLGDEPRDLGFNVYRSRNGGEPVKLNPVPLTAGTWHIDDAADLSLVSEYSIRAVAGGVEQAASRAFRLEAGAPVRSEPYLSIPLQAPAPQVMPDASVCTYSANDCSTGDLDGDGRLDLVVKWDPSNSQDNSKSGVTGNVYLDAYTLDGRRLWRIDLGRNIRAGAHYTQFIVYDLDGDGRAEVACKTADGTVDGTGAVVGDPSADHRNTGGYVLKGPEFLSVFAGATGAELARINYEPGRVPDGNLAPTGAQIKAVWGDDYGNRIDRFLACVAHLDGERPSLVMCRGYYTRSVLAAYDYRDGVLTRRWLFDSADGVNGAYGGQGNHNLSVADVDGDGRDEIIYGSATIDDNGTGLYNTKLHHGDALHVSDIVPSRPGLEVWACHEDWKNNGGIGLSLRDAATGAVLFSVPASADIGRACAGDIDPAHPGMECWGATGGLYASNGALITASRPDMNFMIWWDGDLQREILNSNYINKWNPATNKADRLMTATGCSSNNTTKSTPCLSADLFGDWREELVLRTTDSSELRVFTTTLPTPHRLPTLMHDSHYRASVAWQNVAYNQPPHTGYQLGADMPPPPVPDLRTVSDTSGGKVVNLSGRALTGPLYNPMVVGFYTLGTDMRALVRAVGPTLIDYHVPVPAADPRLDFFRGLQWSEANDNWGQHADAAGLAALMSRCYAFALPSDSLDAAVMPLLPQGGFTAEARNKPEADGVALVEIYADPLTTTSRLVNVSVRAHGGGTGKRVVAGFTIIGDTPRTVLIRAVGPGLVDYLSNFMADPYMELWHGGKMIHASEDWQLSGVRPGHFASTGAFPLRDGSKDAALVLTLHPGLYTAEIYTRSSGEGVVLAEVFDMSQTPSAR